MSNKDLEIKTEIEKLMQSESRGTNLKTYFENLPDKKIRRHLHILSHIYLDNESPYNNYFVFIHYVLTSEKFLKQYDSLPDFIRSLSIINFTASQKKQLANLVKQQFEKLCEVCGFELDGLLIYLLGKAELFKYLESVSTSKNIAVLWRISDILRYEDFSGTGISDESLENLKNHIEAQISISKRNP